MSSAGVVAQARAAGVTIAIAESLTAGAVMSQFAEVPGASRVLAGGVVAYTSELKHRVLGVSERALTAHGPVHPQVARQMADGVRRLLHTDVAVATTGVAGPGPADGHPAGTVYVAALAGFGEEERFIVRGYQLGGTRSAVRIAAVGLAIAALGTAIDSV